MMSAYLHCDFDAEIARHLLLSGSQGIELLAALRDAPQQPPVTSDTLAELDIRRLINNPQLRHDVNFDRELYLRLNPDRARREEALRSADDYWKALEAELFVLVFSRNARAQSGETKQLNRDKRKVLVQASRKRLPGIFKIVCHIAIDLVPAQDQSKIMDRLDLGLWLQQIELLALVQLGNLPYYCTSMRDHIVHCAMLWRRQFRALSEGWKYVDQITADASHTMHCANFLMEKAELQVYREQAINVVVGKSGCHVREV